MAEWARRSALFSSNSREASRSVISKKQTSTSIHVFLMASFEWANTRLMPSSRDNLMATATDLSTEDCSYFSEEIAEGRTSKMQLLVVFLRLLLRNNAHQSHLLSSIALIEKLRQPWNQFCSILWWKVNNKFYMSNGWAFSIKHNVNNEDFYVDNQSITPNKDRIRFLRARTLEELREIVLLVGH